MNVEIENIGSIHMGIDGSDQYVLMKVNEDTDAMGMTGWLLERCYHESNYPGGYFCTRVTVTPHPGKDSAYIGIIHHRYNV